MGRQLDRTAAFSLIPADDWRCLLTDYVNTRRHRVLEAGRSMDQAIAFVATAAAIFAEGRWHELPHPMVPSRDIGEAWGLLIKHTTVYRALSEKLGAFVDWLPYREALAADVEATIAAIDVTNYVLHGEVWNVNEPAQARAGVVGL